MPKETGKRKKVVLTIQQKLEILDKLKAGQSDMREVFEGFDREVREVFEGFDREVREVKEALGDYKIVTEEDIQEWLTVDEGGPGYALQSTKEIAEEVMHGHDNDDDDDDDDPSDPSMSLATVRSHIDGVLQFLDQRPRDISNSNQLYPMMRAALSDVIEKQLFLVFSAKNTFVHPVFSPFIKCLILLVYL